ncbi:MAG: carboxypeptidase-like regulatory domain-containing protein, partial [Flavobacteriales bacterium]
MINLKKRIFDSRKLKTRAISFFQKGMFVVFLLVGLVVSAQQTITGVVADESGVPLPGVNVVIKGTNVGVSSDFDGNYSIKAEAEDVIVFSFIGFVDQEVPVGNNSDISVLLVASFDELDEVIVTTGYGQSRKRDLTGAISQIRTETITRANPLQAAASLQGQVAGV